MADRMPNYEVEIFRLEVEIDTLELNVKRNRLRIMELDDEIRRLKENEVASIKAIEDHKKNLKALKQEHLKENDNG